MVSCLFQSGGLGGLKYPLLSDFSKSIARDYNVLIESEGVPLRGLFIIDPEVKYNKKFFFLNFSYMKKHGYFVNNPRNVHRCTLLYS